MQIFFDSIPFHQPNLTDLVTGECRMSKEPSRTKKIEIFRYDELLQERHRRCRRDAPVADQWATFQNPSPRRTLEGPGAGDPSYYYFKGKTPFYCDTPRGF
jgi:hypothetical protein